MNKLPQLLVLLIVGIFALHFTSCSSSKGSDVNSEKETLVKTLEEKKAALDKAKQEVQEAEKQLTTVDPNYFKNKASKKARLISTQAVKQKDFEQYAEFQGTIETKNDYMLSSEVGGLLRSLNVKEGQRVKKGQLIGQVDDEIIRRNMDELETSIQLARNTLITQQQLVKDDDRALKSQLSELEVSIALARDMVSKQKRLNQDNTTSLNRGIDEIDVSISLAKDMVEKRKALIGKDKIALKEQLTELEVALNLAKDVFGRRQKLWDQNIGSEIEYIKAKNDVQSLEQKMTTVKAQIAKAETGYDIELESAKKNLESLQKKKSTLKAQIAQAGTGNDIQLNSAKRNLESLLQKKRTVELQIAQAGTGHNLQVENAQKNVESLEKKKATLEAQLKKANIYAPASGVVDMVLTERGEMAGPGAPIVKLVSTTNLQAVADVPESYLASIKKGDKVMIDVPTLNIEKEATIQNIGALINPKNRTIKIEVDVSNKDGKLKPNLTAMVKVKEFGEKGAVVVPTNLVLDDKDGYYVFVVTGKDGAQKASKKYIKTGQSYAGETIITEGLTGTEQIVSDGVRMVSDGELVKVLN